MNTVSVVVIVGLVVMVGLMGVACYAKGRADEQKRWLRMSRTRLLLGTIVEERGRNGAEPYLEVGDERV
jgi:hypothetical protein